MRGSVTVALHDLEETETEATSGSRCLCHLPTLPVPWAKPHGDSAAWKNFPACARERLGVLLGSSRQCVRMRSNAEGEQGTV